MIVTVNVSAQTSSPSGASVSTTASNGMPLVWNHAAATFASATNRVAWLNGVAATAETTSRVPSGINTDYLGVRGGTSPAAPLLGAMAHAAIWNIDLTASEIAALAAGISPLEIRPANLKRYWPLTAETNNGYEYDLAGSHALQKITGTLSGDNDAGWLIEPAPFNQRILRSFQGVVTYQYARPSSDIAAGGWLPSTGGDLYAMLDETAADDADYIYSPDNPTTQQFEVRLTSLGDPLSSSNHTIAVRLKATGADTNFDLNLVQNTTVLDSWTENVTVAAGVVERSRTLSAAVADSITDYGNLRIRGVAKA